jgi:hypothetical protein
MSGRSPEVLLMFLRRKPEVVVMSAISQGGAGKAGLGQWKFSTSMISLLIGS